MSNVVQALRDAGGAGLIPFAISFISAIVSCSSDDLAADRLEQAFLRQLVRGRALSAVLLSLIA